MTSPVRVRMSELDEDQREVLQEMGLWEAAVRAGVLIRKRPRAEEVPPEERIGSSVLVAGILEEVPPEERAEVRLASVRVRPHVRVVGGRTIPVKGYVREGLPGVSPPKEPFLEFPRTPQEIGAVRGRRVVARLQAMWPKMAQMSDEGLRAIDDQERERFRPIVNASSWVAFTQEWVKGTFWTWRSELAKGELVRRILSPDAEEKERRDSITALEIGMGRRGKAALKAVSGDPSGVLEVESGMWSRVGPLARQFYFDPWRKAWRKAREDLAGAMARWGEVDVVATPGKPVAYGGSSSEMAAAEYVEEPWSPDAVVMVYPANMSNVLKMEEHDRKKGKEPERLEPGHAVAARTVRAAMRHEYGHHVMARMEARKRAEWKRAWMAFKSRAEAEKRGIRERSRRQVRAVSQGREREGGISSFAESLWRGRLLSQYALTNEREGFAEAFAVVSGPLYDRKEWGEEVVGGLIGGELLGWMERFLADEGVSRASIREGGGRDGDEEA